MENNYPPTNPQSNYQRGSSGTGWVRPPGVYFELIGESFNLIKAQLGVWLTASLVSLLLYGILYLVTVFGLNFAIYGSIVGDTSTNPDLGKLVIAQVGGMVVGSIDAAFLMCFLCGFGRMAIIQSQGQTLTLGELFVPFKNFGGIFIASLVYSLATSFGTVLCIIPGLYLTGRLCLAPYYAGIRGDSAGTAITEAWNVSKPHAWGLFGLFVVAGLASAVGFILCGAGLLFTFPIAGMVMGLTYATFAQQRNPVAQA